ncbi:MAG: 4Fe-4S ferredoxin [Lentisphaerae bacterium RIFOXYA12_FULL_48_11]|nr:MAG: 4Fe-4S ferredoxin [Lentisphaerae bacterium RIFOXYA12_FULL_48_11]
MKRKIIKIDHDKCTGCGLCMPNCPEGAIQMIDGKARLVSDLFCDGLGACLGHCPVGAITVEEREAERYDERKVMENIVKQGENVIRAHLSHLRDHKQDEYLQEAISFLNENNVHNPIQEKEMNMTHTTVHSGCPGSQSMKFYEPEKQNKETGKRVSRLTHWPIQLHLMSPEAPQYQGKDVLLAADCTAFTIGSFHEDFLKGKALAIACPKLDDGHEEYIAKIKALIDDAKINTLTVAIMQVPCCGGLLTMAKTATSQASRKVPVKCIVIGLQGEVLSEDWV